MIWPHIQATLWGGITLTAPLSFDACVLFILMASKAGVEKLPPPSAETFDAQKHFPVSLPTLKIPWSRGFQSVVCGPLLVDKTLSEIPRDQNCFYNSKMLLSFSYVLIFAQRVQKQPWAKLLVQIKTRVPKCIHTLFTTTQTHTLPHTHKRPISFKNVFNKAV